METTNNNFGKANETSSANFGGSGIDLIRSAMNFAKEEKYTEALDCFKRFRDKYPDEAIGYLGHAVFSTYTVCTRRQLREDIHQAATLKCSDIYKNDFKAVLEYENGNGITLIRTEVGQFDYQPVKELIDLGAEFDKVTPEGTTCLWRVCHKQMPKGNEEDGIKIAQLLLELGAKTNVVSSHGVPLLNENTDPRLVKMIKRRNKGVKLNHIEDKEKKEKRTTAIISGVLMFVIVAIVVAMFSSLNCFFSLIGLVLFALGLYSALALWASVYGAEVKNKIFLAIGVIIGIIGFVLIGVPIGIGNTFEKIVSICLLSVAVIGAIILICIFVKNRIIKK